MIGLQSNFDLTKLAKWKKNRLNQKCFHRREFLLLQKALFWELVILKHSLKCFEKHHQVNHKALSTKTTTVITTNISAYAKEIVDVPIIQPSQRHDTMQISCRKFVGQRCNSKSSLSLLKTDWTHRKKQEHQNEWYKK